MARFRAEKIRLLEVLGQNEWYDRIREEVRDSGAAVGLISPLLSFLPRPEYRERAAWALGEAVAAVARNDLEAGRVIVRRLMWSLNEESGNLGWGVPEAMGCILARIPELAGEYAGILLSYAHDTGREDNFLDHAPLRAGVFRGVARLARVRPELFAGRLPVVVSGLEDADAGVRGMAALAVKTLAGRLPFPAECRERALQRLRELAASAESEVVWFDGHAERRAQTAVLARETIEIMEKSEAPE